MLCAGQNSIFRAMCYIFAPFLGRADIYEYVALDVYFFLIEAVEAVIQDLPKFRLKEVPPDCSKCPISLEEFHVFS
ncbi:hypothetical protein RHSIM_Rhsim03G0021700 [Rhododendron simsii]|uniref:Uncharacterized protein n=1 Tax=Rhododendron simsii TaxID=118357 RepID=A0A834H8L5_RHOSS|nr:hypothetical protein RHSIM_Rhsim03G0021700 [Rhododendron simsii]